MRSPTSRPTRRASATLSVLLLGAGWAAGGQAPPDIAPAVRVFGELLDLQGWGSALAVAVAADRECSPKQVKAALATCGMACSVQELYLASVAELDQPVLVFWHTPGPPTVVTGLTDDSVQMFEGRDPQVYPRSSFARFFPATVVVPVAPAGPQARVAVDPVHVDLGNTLRGTAKSVEFRITNRGSRPLELSSVRYSCRSCTEVTLDRTLAAPGETVLALLTFRSMEFGRYGANATIRTTDPLRPLVVLTWSVETPADYVLSPPEMSATCAKREPLTKVLLLTTPPWVRVLSAALDQTDTYVDVSNINYNDALAVWNISIAIPPSEKPGLSRHQLTIETTDPQRRQIVVPVAIRVTPELSALPETIFAGKQEMGVTRALSVVITRSGGGAFEIGGVTVAEGWVRVAQIRQEGAGYRLTVEVTPVRTGLAQGVIEVSTNVPGEEEFHVPVMVWGTEPLAAAQAER